MPVDFQAEFARSQAPVRWNGKTIQPAMLVHVRRGDRIEISFLRHASKPIQGISVLSEDRACELEVGSVRSRAFSLWTDIAPKHVSVLVRKPVRRDADVFIRNIWRDEKHGTMMYGLNAAAMHVEPQSDGAMLATCSDGWLGPDFNDLVVLIRLVRSE